MRGGTSLESLRKTQIGVVLPTMACEVLNTTRVPNITGHFINQNIDCRLDKAIPNNKNTGEKTPRRVRAWHSTTLSKPHPVLFGECNAALRQGARVTPTSSIPIECTSIFPVLHGLYYSVGFLVIKRATFMLESTWYFAETTKLFLRYRYPFRFTL